MAAQLVGVLTLGTNFHQENTLEADLLLAKANPVSTTAVSVDIPPPTSVSKVFLDFSHRLYGIFTKTTATAPGQERAPVISEGKAVDIVKGKRFLFSQTGSF